MNRRTFLAAAGTAALLSPFTGYALPAQQTHRRYLTARADQGGHYYITGFDAEGRLRFDLPLPSRGHDVALHPTRPIAAQVARRPGRYLLVVDVATGRVLHRAESAEGRHFYGHGVFSPDGRWFYTTENDYDNGRGIIGVRDANDHYRQVAEYPSHGIGPHELLLLGDGTTLAVANGGMQTHPDTGRATLNLETMKPSLSYIDRRDGRLLEQYHLPGSMHKNSIRHLGLNGDDTVCFIMQYQGSRREHPPLVGLHRRGSQPRLLSAPAAIQERMRNYCGSACADPSGSVFAVSSPKGGLVTFWNADSGAYLGHTDLPDGCGIAPGSDTGEFIFSSGLGAVQCYRLGGDHRPLGQLASLDARWDNHMALLTWQA